MSNDNLNGNRFAVLIDADNIAEKYIKLIFDEIANDGVATYKRIYGDWTKPTLISWKNVLLSHSILPIQQYSYTTGKNATDSAMIIDAMDILFSGNVDGFCLVSSDSDFTRLAARLRESGMFVVGMGERKTPKPFISACNRFKYLDILAGDDDEIAPSQLDSNARQLSTRTASARQDNAVRPHQESKQPETNKEMTDLRTIVNTVRNLVEEYSDEDGWMFTGSIGNQLVNRYSDFDVRNFGFKKLTSFLESLDIFEIKSVRTGDDNARLIYVKLK